MVCARAWRGSSPRWARQERAPWAVDNAELECPPRRWPPREGLASCGRRTRSPRSSSGGGLPGSAPSGLGDPRASAACRTSSLPRSVTSSPVAARPCATFTRCCSAPSPARCAIAPGHPGPSRQSGRPAAWRNIRQPSVVLRPLWAEEAEKRSRPSPRSFPPAHGLAPGVCARAAGPCNRTLRRPLGLRSWVFPPSGSRGAVRRGRVSNAAVIRHGRCSTRPAFTATGARRNRPRRPGSRAISIGPPMMSTALHTTASPGVRREQRAPPPPPETAPS